MRKIPKLLSALCLLLGSLSASAQGNLLTADQITPGLHVALKAVADNNQNWRIPSAHGEANFEHTYSLLVEEAEGGFYLKRVSLGDEGYIQKPAQAGVGSVAVGTIDNAAIFTAEQGTARGIDAGAGFINSSIRDAATTLRLVTTATNNDATWLNTDAVGSNMKYAVGKGNWSVFNVYDLDAENPFTKITDVSQIDESKTYIISCVGDGRQGIAFAGTNHNKFYLNSNVRNVPMNVLPLAYHFRIEKSGNGFYLKNRTGHYLQINGGDASNFVAQPENATLIQANAKANCEAGIWNFKTPNSYLNVNASDNEPWANWQLTIWNEVGDANGKWEIYMANYDEGDVLQPYEIEYTYNGEVIADPLSLASTSLPAMPAINKTGINGGFFSVPSASVSGNAQHAVTFLTPSFEFSTPGNIHLYTAKVRNDKHVVYDPEANILRKRAADDAPGQVKEAAFAFYGDVANGVYIYNLAAGNFLTATDTDSEEATFNNIPTRFDVIPFNSNGGYLFKISGTNNAYLHDLGGNQNMPGHITVWKNAGAATDIGSKFEFTLADDEAFTGATADAEDWAAARERINAYLTSMNSTWTAFEAFSETPGTNIELATLGLMNLPEETAPGFIEFANTAAADGHSYRLGHPQSANTFMSVNGSTLVRKSQADVNNDDVFTLKHATANGRTGFYLYNEYSNTYAKTNGSSNDVTMTSINDATLFTLKNFYNNNGTISFGLSNGTNGTNEYLHVNQGNHTRVVCWSFGENSSWYISAVSDDDRASSHHAGATAFLNGIDADGTIATAPGQYSYTAQAIANAKSTLAAAESSEAEAKYAAAEAAFNFQGEIYALQAGRLYRFANVDGGKYLSSTPNDNGRRIQMITDAAGNKLEDIFYYDGEHLISVENGKVIGKFNGNKESDESDWKLVLASETDKVGTVTFSDAGDGKYYITTFNGRYIHGADNIVNCGQTNNGTAPEGEGYKWTISNVEWLPVPESQKGKNLVPYYSPVKLNIDTRIRTVHVLHPVINNGRVELQPSVNEAGEVVTDSYVPANTPVVIQMRDDIDRDGNTGLVYLEVNYSDLATDHSAAFSRVKEADKQYLALDAANRTYLPMAEGDILTGFRSYIELPEGKEPVQHRIRYTNVLSAGKVYAFKNADNGRGYIKAAADANQDLLWTSNKENADTTNAPYLTDANYQWTLVKDNNNNVYLFNLGRKQFASPYRCVDSDIAEFVWHFTDEPADFDIEFFDSELKYNLAEAQIHIVAGENGMDTQRPGGMTVVNGNENGPVQCSNNSKEKNGNRFTFIELTDVELPADLPTAEAIAAKQGEMDAAHGEIAGKVAELLKSYENSELSEDAIGYYTQEATAAYDETLQAAATPEAKKYATLRGAKAAEGQINEFKHEGVYNLKDANGHYIIAEIDRTDGDENKFGSKITIKTVENGPDYSDEKNTYWQAYNWLASVDENGVLTFTHDFLIAKPKPETPASRAAAEIDPDDYLAPVTKILASGTPVYDGFGNISGLTAADSSYATIAGASTADADHSDATGISEIIAAPAANQAIYDLQGRRVNKASKGIYIINGVKTLVR